MKTQINTWNLKKKIIFFQTLMIAVTSMIILVVSMTSAVYYMREQAKEMARGNLETLASNYNDTLLQYQKLAMALVISKSAQDYCKSSESSGSQYEALAEKLYDDMQNMLNMQGNMNFAVVMQGKADGYVYKGNSSLLDTRFISEYQKDYAGSIPMKKDSSIRMSFGEGYFKRSIHTLTIYHPIYSTSTSSVSNGEIGMLILNFKDNMLDQLYSKENQSGGQRNFLTDEAGNVIFQDKNEQVSYREKMNGTTGSFQKSGKLINYQKIGSWGYYLVDEIPAKELYTGSFGILLILLLVIVGMMLFSIFTLRKMIMTFYQPMDRVLLAMDDVAEGRLEKRLDEDSIDADSRKLAACFNTMMDKIHMLLEQVKQEQHQLEQTRFNALYSQIKPHFLYNTLDCIHWQAVTDGNREISVMVKAVAQYYRLCLSKGKEIIPLSQELEHINAYLIIQNMRYDNIIELENRIPETYFNLKIPKMTLQPLIENAIYHGIRVKEGKKGKIILGIEEIESAVNILVSDDGAGMEEAKLQEMNLGISEYNEKLGYGVGNVNKRIELMFGSQYGISFAQNEPEGITVKIHLPAER